jgi:hypothetical protein
MPGVLDVWNQSFWSLTELSDAINILPYQPRMVESMGVFVRKSITTTSVSVEYKNGEIQLVGNQPRGVTAEANTITKRVGRSFNCLHLPLHDAVKADDVQGIRAWGQSTVTETVQGKVNDKLSEMKGHINATLEWHRVGALKGKLLDADGSSELLDINTEFGIARPTKDFDFSSDATDVRIQCMELKRLILAQIGGYEMSMVGVLCSDEWFDELIQHASVKDTFKYFNEAARLRDNLAYETFDFAGCRFVNYRGNVSSQAFITASEAIAFPMGTNGLFTEYYAPADYEETVNTPGQQFYAKSEPMKFNKGREIEAQSNPLMLCHRPQACYKLTMTTT